MELIINGNPNLENSILRPLERDTFFEELDDLNINDNFKKCNSKLKSNKKRILKILFDLKILKFIKK